MPGVGKVREDQILYSYAKGGYRRGHNGADLKSVVAWKTRFVGSNPTPPAK